MTPGAIDDYVSRLERELRQRGLVDAPRIVDEARDHLVDAVEDGQRCGLSVEDAEREALERFGAADIVAAHAVSERDRTMDRLAAFLETVWHHRWWILAPTALTAVVTSVMSYYFLPTRYQSESVVRIVSPRVSAGVHTAGANPSHARLQEITQNILSRTRLERIISDFGLYKDQNENAPLGDAVLQMRRNITVNFRISNDAHDGDAGRFSVSFMSSDPGMAQKITERLTNLIVEENLREKEVEALGTSQFIDSQLADVRSRIVAYEQTLEDLRAQSGRRPLSQADLLPYEVLQETYKALLIDGEELKIAANLQRRAIGERFVVIDPPRLPEQPVGPSRLGVNVAGTFAGFGLGLILCCVRGRASLFTAGAAPRR